MRRPVRYVGVFLLLLTVAETAVLGVQAATPPPNVTWSIAADGTQLAKGAPVHFLVIGPANASFTLQVTAPPWNGSVPVFSESGVTSPGTNLTLVGYANATMNTSAFAEQTYQATVTVGDTPEAWTRFALVPPLNLTNLNATIGEILQAQIRDEATISYLQERAATLSYWQNVQWWTVVGVGLAFGAVVLFAERRRAVLSLAYRLNQRIQSAYVGSEPSALRVRSGSTPGQYLMRPAPGSAYVSNYCDVCRVPTDWPTLRAHIESSHRSVIGPRGAVLGVHGWLDPVRARENRAGEKDVDTGGEREVAGRRRPKLMDMGEILGE